MNKVLDILRHHPNTRPIWKVVAGPVGLGMYVYMKLIDITANVTVLGNIPTEPVIFTKWHGNIPYLLIHHGKFHRALLTGNSPYMEPVITMVSLHGLKVLRGGSKEHRNMDQNPIALMSEELLREKNAVVIAIDGPAGPVYEPKRGFLELAKEAGVPIVPVVYACKRGERSKTRWDGMWWPALFDDILVQYGEPYRYDPKLSIEEQIVTYKGIMMKLKAECEAKVEAMN